MSVLGILAGAAFATSALQSWATFQQGQFQKEMAYAQADVMKQQAQQTKQEAGMQIGAADYAAVHQLAAVKAGTAAAGIEPAEGSPAFIQATSVHQQQINDMYTKYAANVRASDLYTQASLTQAAGEEAAQAADIQAVTGLISGGISSYAGYKGGTLTGPSQTTGGGTSPSFSWSTIP